MKSKNLPIKIEPAQQKLQSDINKPINPLVSQSLIKYQMLKNELLDHFFSQKMFNLSLKEYSQTYSKPYQLLNNSNLIIANDKKYRNVQDSFLDKYENDMKMFAVKVYEILSKIKGSKAHQYISEVSKLINIYTKFNHWIYRTFMFIQRNAIRAQGTKLYFTGVKILKVEIIEKIYDDIYDAVYNCLESYKEGNLGQLEPLQIVIKFIGIIGFTKFKLVDMAKISSKFQYISNRKEGDQSPQNPYDTAYFKKNFIGRLTKDIKKKYADLVISMLQLSVPQYFQKAKKLIQIEQDTADHFYAFQGTKEIVIRIVLQALIVQKAEFLLKNPKSGMSRLMKQKDIKNLVQIFNLLKKANMSKIFFKQFQNYIHSQGQQILNKISVQDEKAMKKQTIIYVLGQIIQFNEFVDKIRYDIDENDADLQKAQNAGFQAFCNIGNKVCNFLAYYADLMLKKQDGGSQVSSQDVVVQIKKISKYLFSYDYFLKMHQKLLGLRILYDNFKNQEAEYALIGMLKNQAGLNATSKLSNMITDQKNSQTWNIQFHLKNKYGFGFEVMMLTSGSWQVNDPKCGKTLVPKQLIKAVEDFQVKFLQKLPNRGISWIFTHGRAVIQFINNANMKYIVVLNNYQLLTLLQMQNNQFNEIKFSDLLSKLKIQDQNFYKSSLINLLKYGILLKDGNPAKIQSKSQKLRVNFDFKYKTQKVGCSIIPKYTQKLQNLGAQVSAERCILIDANLVKIMKQKRRCAYSQLIIEVQNMCKTFKAEVSQIKLRIQNCIQRQFFQRDSKDMNILLYKP